MDMRTMIIIVGCIVWKNRKPPHRVVWQKMKRVIKIMIHVVMGTVVNITRKVISVE